MANPFIEKEVNKIVNDKNLEYPKNLALATAWILANFKGINIKIFDVHESSSLCDYNIIASAQNVTQARSMVDELTYNLKKSGAHVVSIEGLTDADWILLDMGDIIIHIFQDVSRDIFDLDTLWGAFPTVEIPSSYYFSHAESETSGKDGSTDNYF